MMVMIDRDEGSNSGWRVVIVDEDDDDDDDDG